MKKPSASKILPFAVLVPLLIVIVVAGVMILRGYKEKRDSAAAAEPDYMTVEYGGDTYRYGDDIYNLLIMGIDTDGKFEEGQSSHTGGQADTIFIVSVNNSAKTISTVQLNRDTYTKIPKIGLLGDGVGFTEGQLALAYAYGDGGEDSCENTVAAVSELLGGIPIDGYMSVKLDGVEPFVDALGGIKIRLEEDFESFDPTMKNGATLILNGKQSRQYVQGRTGVGDQENTSRMKRQKQFYTELLKSVDGLLGDDIARIQTVFDSIEDYSYYSISVSKLITLYTSASSYTRNSTVTPEGELDYDNEYVRFYPDEDSLRDIIINTWYTKTEK